MSGKHSAATGAVIHVLHRWSPANQAAREALTVQSTDVGKMARQVSDGSFWILTNHSPATWTRCSGADVAEDAANAAQDSADSAQTTATAAGTAAANAATAAAAAQTTANSAANAATTAQAAANAAQATANQALDRLPFSDSDHVVGNFSTTSTVYTPLLQQDGGDPVEVVVTDPPAGAKAIVSVTGTMNNGLPQIGGPSDQVFMRPVVNGVSYDDGFLGGCFCQGGQRTAVTGEWVIPLSGTSTIRVELRTLTGNLVGCFPNDPQGDYLMTSVKLTVRLGS